MSTAPLEATGGRSYRKDDKEELPGEPEPKADLSELLSETRILLPGTEVFLAFLTSLPFTDRFGQLTSTERTVYVCIYFSTLIAFVCMVAPAAYHRIARPIPDKPRFKVFANLFLVVGLVPVSVSVVLATYLVTSMVMGDGTAIWSAAGMAALVIGVWWAFPFLRAHDRFPVQDA